LQSSNTFLNRSTEIRVLQQRLIERCENYTRRKMSTKPKLVEKWRYYQPTKIAYSGGLLPFPSILSVAQVVNKTKHPFR